MDEQTMNKDGDENKDHMNNNEGGNKKKIKNNNRNKYEIKEHRIRLDNPTIIYKLYGVEESIKDNK